jgi:hypothetical protein
MWQYYLLPTPYKSTVPPRDTLTASYISAASSILRADTIPFRTYLRLLYHREQPISHLVLHWPCGSHEVVLSPSASLKSTLPPREPKSKLCIPPALQIS